MSAPVVETDMTVHAFAQWLTELRARNSRTLQEMLSEMSIIRDGITSNNMELSDFKRGSTGISQQMQSQLTDLREKLTNAFSEITALVGSKGQSEREMMQDINALQQHLSVKTQELEALKRSYSQAHTQLQSSLIQIQNHLQVTNSEVQQAKVSCERVQRDTVSRFGDIDKGLRYIEDDLKVGNAENRNQMLQLQEDITCIHEAIANVTAEFNDHKRAANSVHNKFQSAVWGLEEGKKRQQAQLASAQLMQSIHGSQEKLDVNQVAGSPRAAPMAYRPSVSGGLIPGQMVDSGAAGSGAYPCGNKPVYGQAPGSPQAMVAVGHGFRPAAGQMQAMAPSSAGGFRGQPAVGSRSSVAYTQGMPQMPSGGGSPMAGVRQFVAYPGTYGHG